MNELSPYGAKLHALAVEISELLRDNPHWHSDWFAWLSETQDIAQAFGDLLSDTDPVVYLDDWIAHVRQALDHATDEDGQ